MPWDWSISLAQSRDPQQVKSLQQWFLPSLQLGSDCTGSNGCWWGLREFGQAMQLTQQVSLPITQLFGSEAPCPLGKAPVKFLRKNATPNILFNDVSKREANGPVFWPEPAGSIHDVPVVDCWQAGTVCRDLSSCNTKPRPLDLVLSSTSGPSTITLHGSLQYIKAKRPKLCFLENVYNKNEMQTIGKLIKSMKYLQFVVV